MKTKDKIILVFIWFFIVDVYLRFYSACFAKKNFNHSPETPGSTHKTLWYKYTLERDWPKE